MSAVYWSKQVIRDGIAQATLTSTGSVATLLRGGPWRTLQIYSYVHSAGGTSPTFRLRYEVSPNAQTGVPASINANARWGTLLNGATYSGAATGLKVLAVPLGQVSEYGRVGWVTTGTGPKYKVSIWAGLQT
jgi:hypothetical protein